MPDLLLIDNWTLQDAGKLLDGGLSDETADELSPSEDGQKCHYVEHPADLMRIEALFQVLHNIVLSQTACVDAKYTYTWERFPALDPLLEAELVVAKQFYNIREDWLPLRDAAVDDLCFCPEIARIHQENVDAFKRSGSTINPLVGNVVWGGAGMLARAALAGMPYAPHPQRERFFAHAELLRGPTTASQNLFNTFVQSTRVKLHSRADETGLVARFNLPPVAVEILMEAQGVEDILPIALQMREKYRELRGWLGEFQNALNADDMAGVRRHHELLQNVARQVDATGVTGGAVPSSGKVTMEMGTTFQLDSKRGASEAVRQRVQIRAQISRLILAESGRRAITKLLKLFGEENTKLGLARERELLAKFGRKSAK